MPGSPTSGPSGAHSSQRDRLGLRSSVSSSRDHSGARRTWSPRGISTQLAATSVRASAPSSSAGSCSSSRIAVRASACRLAPDSATHRYDRTASRSRSSPARRRPRPPRSSRRPRCPSPSGCAPSASEGATRPRARRPETARAASGPRSRSPTAIRSSAASASAASGFVPAPARCSQATRRIGSGFGRRRASSDATNSPGRSRSRRASSASRNRSCRRSVGSGPASTVTNRPSRSIASSRCAASGVAATAPRSAPAVSSGSTDVRSRKSRSAAGSRSITSSARKSKTWRSIAPARSSPGAPGVAPRSALSARRRPAGQPCVRTCSAIGRVGREACRDAERARLRALEAQVVEAELGHLALRAQPCERDRRLAAAGDRDRPARRQPLEQVGEEREHCRALDAMQVVDHDHAVRHVAGVERIDHLRRDGAALLGRAASAAMRTSASGSVRHGGSNGSSAATRHSNSVSGASSASHETQATAVPGRQQLRHGAPAPRSCRSRPRRTPARDAASAAHRPGAPRAPAGRSASRGTGFGRRIFVRAKAMLGCLVAGDYRPSGSVPSGGAISSSGLRSASTP